MIDERGRARRREGRWREEEREVAEEVWVGRRRRWSRRRRRWSFLLIKRRTSKGLFLLKVPIKKTFPVIFLFPNRHRFFDSATILVWFCEWSERRCDNALGPVLPRTPGGGGEKLPTERAQIPPEVRPAQTLDEAINK